MKLGMKLGMSAQRNHSLLVAVPYYGTLSLPPLGLSRVFFVAAVDTAERKVRRVEIEVWDPNQEPSLCVWMRKQGLSGVICSDSGCHYRAALNAENIWLVEREEGEAAEVVERWAAGGVREEGSWSLGRQSASWCHPLAV